MTGKFTMMLPALALLFGATGGTAAAMPAASLWQAQQAGVVQVDHRGRPHRRRARAYAPEPYFDDYSHFYPAVRGFADRNPVPRGNMRGCTVDLGYGRYESCDKN